MYGISSSGKENIANAVAKMFDRLAFKLLGRIPKLQNIPHLLGEVSALSLAHIFIQTLGGREPNHFERDVLKSILGSSHGYVEALKNKTSSNIVEAVDALVKEAKAKGEFVTSALVGMIFAQEMLKAQNQMKVIAEAETTKTRNIGHTMEIVHKAKEIGVEDPTCFFVVIRDKSLCSECEKLHMMPDKITPRVWKLSELSHSWHKRGENRPSCNGEHPFCRCSLTMLAPGWGFKNGFISFISLDHDEFKKQRSIS